MVQDELHLDKAPIAEALISIHIVPLSDDKMPSLDEAFHDIQSDYPESEDLNQFEFGWHVEPGTPAVQSHRGRLFGRKLISKDKRQLVLFRRDGFSFSRLPPYERWESFRSEARRIWHIYRAATGPLSIVRFGLRYINRLLIPRHREISDYLRLYPHIPDNRDGSPRALNSSFLRIDSILTEPTGQLIVQQATLPTEQEGLVTLSLDFDLQFSQIGSDEGYVWNTLEKARDIKNQLFVDSLTPTYLETFR